MLTTECEGITLEHRGRIMKQLLLNNDINLLITGNATRYHSDANSCTAIDPGISSAIYTFSKLDRRVDSVIESSLGSKIIHLFI